METAGNSGVNQYFALGLVSLTLAALLWVAAPGVAFAEDTAPS